MNCIYYIKLLLALFIGIAGVVLGFHMLALNIALGMGVILCSAAFAVFYCLDTDED